MDACYTSVLMKTMSFCHSCKNVSVVCCADQLINSQSKYIKTLKSCRYDKALLFISHPLVIAGLVGFLHLNEIRQAGATLAEETKNLKGSSKFKRKFQSAELMRCSLAIYNCMAFTLCHQSQVISERQPFSWCLGF